MENNQRGGVLAFSLVAVVLFAALVGGVYLVKNYGDRLADSPSQVASETTDDKDKADKPKDTSDEAKKGDDKPAAPSTPATDESEAPAGDPADNSGQLAQGDRSDQPSQADDYDEVVEAPDDATHSQTPGSIGSTGPSQVAATGPTDALMTVIPLAAVTTSAVAYGRSRSAL